MNLNSSQLRSLLFSSAGIVCSQRNSNKNSPALIKCSTFAENTQKSAICKSDMNFGITTVELLLYQLGTRGSDVYYCLLHLECHSITFSILNPIGLFSTKRGKRDVAN